MISIIDKIVTTSDITEEQGLDFSQFRVTCLPLMGFVCLCLLNIILYDSLLMLFMTILQVLFIFYLFFSKGLDHAVFWHFIFIITGVEATTANVKDLNEVFMYSYLRIKVYGPFGLAYLMSVFFFICSLRNRVIVKGMFYSLSIFLALLFVQGVVFSCFGMIMQHHILEQFIEYNVYLGMVCCNMLLLIHVMTPYMREKLFPTLLTVLVASPIATFLSWSIFKKVTLYSVFDAALQSQIDFFSPCLLFFFLYPVKGKFFFVLGLLCMACNLAFSGGGGELLIFGVFSVFFCYLCFFKRRGLFILKGLIIICAIILGQIITQILITQDTSSIFSQKIQEVFSLFSIFTVDSLQTIYISIPHSPYIRISEFLNIFFYYIHHPLFLLFGQGPGGYYEDILNMLNYTILNDTDYSWDLIFSGKFSYAHGSFPTLLLINGVVGLLGVFFFSMRYMLLATKYPFLIVAFIWPLTGFYFNIQTAIIAMLMLFSFDLLLPVKQA